MAGMIDPATIPEPGMRPRQFYESIRDTQEEALLTIGRIEVVATRYDGMAADLILHLLATYPDLTQGETEEVLSIASFWVRFWAGVFARRVFLAQQQEHMDGGGI